MVARFQVADVIVAVEVCLTRRWPKDVERVLAAEFNAHLSRDDAAFSRQRLADALARFEVVCPTVTDVVDAGLLATPGNRVRLLANFGVGFNHIDLDAARRAGVAVTNTPGVLTDCTADLAITLMMMVLRRAGEGERELRAGRWTGWRPTHLMGARVTGKTLGIVGAGRIGLATARRARFGFGMSILLTSRTPPDPERVAELDAEVLPLDALMARADVVSLHCPSHPQTRGLIDARRLALMRETSVLINTARGDVVDEVALAEALAEGRIRGAGLDVYAAEPRVEPRLLDLENVVLLPHLGSATEETRTAMGMRVVANLRAYARGQPLPDRVV